MKINTKVFGELREIYVDGKTYAIFPNKRNVSGGSQDAWLYSLPNGDIFSHPDKFGALLMVLKDIGGGEWSEDATRT